METGQEQRSINDALKNGHIAVIDPRDSKLPDLLIDKPMGTTSLFLREGRKHGFRADVHDVTSYTNLSGIRYERVDVYLLDGESIKLLLANYPSRGSYVLVRISLRLSWIMGVLGLLRHLVIGQVKFRGVAKLKSEGSLQRWLALESPNFRPRDLYLSGEVGVQGFLDFLRTEKIRYSVLRFYDKLPQLFRSHGDLDLLIGDEEETKIHSYLSDHLVYIGSTPLDIATVSSRYYPPHLANQILDNTIEGAAGSRVPSPKVAFLSFAYHALYHNGFRSGVPSQLANSSEQQKPDNDYAGILAQMASDLGIHVDINLESLDDYLHLEGWRPGFGDLAIIATKNVWARRRFFPHRQTTEVGLGVFILRETALQLGLADKFIEEMEREQFTVIRRTIFDAASKKLVSEYLRGGNWESLSGDTSYEHTPAMAIVVLDTRPYSMYKVKKGPVISRVIPLKIKLRKLFDNDEAESTMVHSTDNTAEAWEYIDVCLPDHCQLVRKEVDEFFDNLNVTPVNQIRFSIRLMLTQIMNWRGHLRRRFVRLVTR